jgi:flagellar assembly protein FliH
LSSSPSQPSGKGQAPKIVGGRGGVLQAFDAFTRNEFDSEGRAPSASFDMAFDAQSSGTASNEGMFLESFDEEPDSTFSPSLGKDLLGEEGRKIVEEAKERAAAIVEKARLASEEAEARAEARATAMLEDARRQVEEVEARAYQEGFAQGEEAGRRLGEQKVESVLKSLRSVMEKMVGQRDALLKASEQELVKLAYLIALQIIHREIQQDPNVVVDVVRTALARTHQASEITIQVSPSDFRFLEGQGDLLRDLTGGKANVQIEPSTEVGRGGCRIVSEAGEVEASIERTLELFRKQIWEQEQD